MFSRHLGTRLLLQRTFYSVNKPTLRATHGIEIHRCTLTTTELAIRGAFTQTIENHHQPQPSSSVRRHTVYRTIYSTVSRWHDSHFSSLQQFRVNHYIRTHQQSSLWLPSLPSTRPSSGLKITTTVSLKHNTEYRNSWLFHGQCSTFDPH